MDNSLAKIVQDTILQYAMFTQGETILCAVSGGADSTALLRLFLQLQKKWAIKICVCHLHHGLRGQEADRDAAFVRRLCLENDIAFDIAYRDVSTYAKQHQQGTEEAARNVRYAYFKEAAEKFGADKVATAHTADDNLETMLFHLTRGAGMRGLCGIPPVRENIIRPLIAVTRAEIEMYLNELRQPFVQDSTNDSSAYTRNRMRHEVVPVLRLLNPKCVQAASRTARLLREDEVYLQEQAKSLCVQLCRAATGGIQFACKSVCLAPPALRGRFLREVLHSLHMPLRECGDNIIQQVLALLTHPNPSARISLPAGFVAERQYDMLWIGKEKVLPPPQNAIALSPDFSDYLWQGMTRLTISKFHGDFNKKFNIFYVDYDKIDFMTLIARTRCPQDSLQLTAKGGHRSLKRLMIDKHVPRGERDRLAVLADRYGVVAVESIGVAYDRLATGKDAIEIRFEGSAI